MPIKIAELTNAQLDQAGVIYAPREDHSEWVEKYARAVVASMVWWSRERGKNSSLGTREIYSQWYRSTLVDDHYIWALALPHHGAVYAITPADSTAYSGDPSAPRGPRREYHTTGYREVEQVVRETCREWSTSKLIHQYMLVSMA